MPALEGRVCFITGASRGIGRAIALRLAGEGARIVIAAKTDRPHPKLPGTIHSVAEEVRAAGGEALAIKLDVRDAEAIERAMEGAAQAFGGIDILVNNASAISLTGTRATPMKRFDLMMAVNARATFACARAAIPYLTRSANPHILTLAPPLSLDPRWLAPHLAYTISKYAMSLCVLGLAEELKPSRIAVNALWPETVIATAALAMLPQVRPERCRRPEIVADAAAAILKREAARCTGNFFIDEEVLREEGVDDFGSYAVSPGTPLLADLFVDP